MKLQLVDDANRIITSIDLDIGVSYTLKRKRTDSDCCKVCDSSPSSPILDAASPILSSVPLMTRTGPRMSDFAKALDKLGIRNDDTPCPVRGVTDDLISLPPTEYDSDEETAIAVNNRLCAHPGYTISQCQGDCLNTVPYMMHQYPCPFRIPKVK